MDIFREVESTYDLKNLNQVYSIIARGNHFDKTQWT